MIQDRAYQVEAEQEIIQKYKDGVRSLVLVIGCGGGKTNVTCSIIEKALKKKKRVMFIAHRRELISNCQDRLTQYGIKADVILGGKKRNVANPVQIASIQSLVRQDLPEASIVFVDECHTALSTSYIDVLNRYKASGSLIVGLTATPFRTDKRVLGEVFDDYVLPITNEELVSRGFVLPTKVYGAGNISSKNFKIKLGEFDKGDLQKAFDVNNVYTNLIENYKRLAGGLSTIVFCNSVEHSIKTAQCFNDNGYKAVHIDGETPKEERDEAIRQYASGETLVLCNYGLLAEGFDVPKTRCVIMNCATTSLIKWIQASGRSQRLFEDKEFGIIIDMADNYMRFGSPEDNVEINLFETRKKKEGVAPVSLCGNCYLVFSPRLDCCPDCGWQKPKAVLKPIEEMVFVELTKAKQKIKEKEEKDATILANIEEFKDIWATYTKNDWNRVHPNLISSFAKFKGYKAGWVYNQRVERKLI